MDFIKNKVILRSLISSIVPLVIFGIVVGLSRAINLTFNYNYGWIAVLVFSVVWPVN